MDGMAQSKIICLGAYTLQEASRYGSVAPQKLSRWIWGTTQYEPVIKAELGTEYIITFHDLVQAKAVQIAREEGIPLPKIRQAIETARKEYGVTLPLARKNKLLWFHGDLHIQLNHIFQVSGKGKHQETAKEIMVPYAKDLHFDAQGLACMWTPYAKFRRQIVIDPGRQFGQPFVEQAGYRADVLFDAYHSEGSYRAAADVYNVHVDDVKVAVAYITQVRQAA
ncbi:MAG: hypothetical protein NTZ17_19055 [Phycisphaerae bacterium]|nr:hypothetical protein [Phycisphaerae bacterium]